MKILAIEREMESADWGNRSAALREEALHVHKMQLSGELREIYFTEEKNAVLILECADHLAAEEIISQLPLVRKGIIRFDILALHPYTGLSRLID